METAEEVRSIDEIPRLLLSRRSAAKALDISVRMVDYAIAAGQLEIRRFNSRDPDLGRFAGQVRSQRSGHSTYDRTISGV